MDRKAFTIDETDWLAGMYKAPSAADARKIEKIREHVEDDTENKPFFMVFFPSSK